MNQRSADFYLFTSWSIMHIDKDRDRERETRPDLITLASIAIKCD